MSELTPVQRGALLAIVALTALAGAADYGAWPAIPRFALATLALGGLAWVVSMSTEQLGEHLGPGMTGMVQSTLGNLPELFVVIFALQKGELVVAQTALVGSILANGLLVLGLVIVVGALRAPDATMRFSKRLPRDTATLLQVTVFIIVLLGLSLAAHDRASHHVKTISAVGAVCLLAVYLAWVVPYLRSDGKEADREEGAGSAAMAGADTDLHFGPGAEAGAGLNPGAGAGAMEGADASPRARSGADPNPDAGSGTKAGARAGALAGAALGARTGVRGASAEVDSRAGMGADGDPGADADEQPAPRLSLGLSLALLVAGGAASAFVSEWFVDALHPAILVLHFSQAFAGLVIVAIAGNAVEHTAGIVLAWKGRSDLAISVVKNSVAQIAAFLFPVLVLVSFALATQLTFALAPVYIGALALGALAIWQVTGDGEAAEFEGWALVALYVILAALTIYE